jgi:hypothetical protein
MEERPIDARKIADFLPALRPAAGCYDIEIRDRRRTLRCSRAAGQTDGSDEGRISGLLMEAG